MRSLKNNTVEAVYYKRALKSSPSARTVANEAPASSGDHEEAKEHPGAAQFASLFTPLTGVEPKPEPVEDLGDGFPCRAAKVRRKDRGSLTSAEAGTRKDSPPGCCNPQAS